MPQNWNWNFLPIDCDYLLIEMTCRDFGANSGKPDKNHCNKPLPASLFDRLFPQHHTVALD